MKKIINIFKKTLLYTAVFTLLFSNILIITSCTTYNYSSRSYEGKSTNIKEEKHENTNLYVNLLIDKGSSFKVFIDGSERILGKNDTGKIFSSANKEITYNNKEIGYNIKIIKSSSGELNLCSLIDIERYVAGVISAEMGIKFKYEALKAQAVAARTYIYQKMKNNPDFIVTNSVQHQVWSEKNIEYFLQFTSETSGEIMTYNGNPIEVFFHSNSGGITTTPDRVWNGKDLPYYTVKRDQYSLENCEWELSSGKYFLRKILQDGGVSIKDSSSYVTRIDLYKRPSDMRVEKIIIFLSSNERIEFSGYKFRQVFGTTKLKSTMFSVKKENDNFIFYGKGYGHGIGMSQYGADNMASQGVSYKNILNFYYKNIEFSMINY